MPSAVSKNSRCESLHNAPNSGILRDCRSRSCAARPRPAPCKSRFPPQKSRRSGAPSSAGQNHHCCSRLPALVLLAKRPPPAPKKNPAEAGQILIFKPLPAYCWCYSLPPAATTSALRIASGDSMIFMKLFAPDIFRSGKSRAMRKRAYSAITLLPVTSIS